MPDFIENELPAAELPPQPEKGPEAKGAAQPERAPVAAPEKVSETTPPVPVAIPAPVATPVVDPVTASIETVLSDDLYEYFQAMTPEEQTKFKQKGEETVSRLSQLVSQTVIKAKEVLRLIAAWLRFIPHVNRYFLEQESKIKTDKILELHKRQHGE